MKMLWCWRCKIEVPMLDESEFKEVALIYSESVKRAKEFRAQYGVPINASIEERFKPVCDRYEQLTGSKESNANAIMHHRLLLYGPPCTNCGKPLRTPRAKLCGACMHPAQPRSEPS
jgi:hypothetical protein